MKRYILFYLLFLQTLISCRKFVTIEPAPNLVRTEEIFSSAETALSAARGVYLQLRAGTQSITSAGLSLYTGLCSDELYTTITTVPNYMNFYENELLPNNSTISSQFYQSAYRTIYSCNAVIKGLEASTGIDSTLRRQLRGEIQVIRALVYCNLLQLFGPVPLITTTDFLENERLGRSSIDSVYNFLEISLLQAIEDLNVAGLTSTKSRVNIDAASIMLGRIYLYQEKWDKALAMANFVISSGRYPLSNSSSLAGIFKKQHAETIFEIAATNGTQPVAEAGIYVPSSLTVRPFFAIHSHIVGSFEPGDVRAQFWVGSNTVGGISYPYPFKYKERSVTSSSTASEFQIVFRVPECYLIRAECYARLGKSDSSIADINTLRSRAGLQTNLSNLTGQALLEEILDERLREFFSEGGHRWADLKRTGKINQVLGALKPGTWQPHDQLWPIPAIEILYNSNLTQNPGY